MGMAEEDIAAMNPEELAAVASHAKDNGIAPKAKIEVVPPSGAAGPDLGSAPVGSPNVPDSGQAPGAQPNAGGAPVDSGGNPAPAIAPGPAVWRNKDHDIPVTVLGIEPQPGPDGRTYARVQSGGQTSFVPVDELTGAPNAGPPSIQTQPQPGAVPGAPPTPANVNSFPTAPNPLDPNVGTAGVFTPANANPDGTIIVNGKPVQPANRNVDAPVPDAAHQAGVGAVTRAAERGARQLNEAAPFPEAFPPPDRRSGLSPAPLPGEGQRPGPRTRLSDDDAAAFAGEQPFQYPSSPPPAPRPAAAPAPVQTAAKAEDEMTPDEWMAKRRAARKIPSIPKPLSLTQFVASLGGMRDPGGELASMGLGQRLPPSKRLGNRRSVINPDGLDPDEMRRRAVDAGYLQDTPYEGGESTSTVNDLLHALGNETRGQPTYSTQDQEAVDRWNDYDAGQHESPEEHDARAQVHAALDSVGTPITDKTAMRDYIDRAAYHVQRGMDPETALERAALELSDLPEAKEALAELPPFHGEPDAPKPKPVSKPGGSSQSPKPGVKPGDQAAKPGAKKPVPKSGKAGGSVSEPPPAPVHKPGQASQPAPAKPGASDGAVRKPSPTEPEWRTRDQPPVQGGSRFRVGDTSQAGALNTRDEHGFREPNRNTGPVQPAPAWLSRMQDLANALAEKMDLPQIKVWAASLKSSTGGFHIGLDRAPTSVRQGQPQEVILNDRFKDEKLLASVLIHEIGHAIQFSKLKAASQATQDAVHAAWVEHVKSIKGDTKLVHLRPFDGYETDHEFGSTPPGYKQYVKMYEEWFADQVHRWIARHTEPTSLVDKFFKGIADMWRDMLAKATGLPPTHRAVDQFMRGIWRGDVTLTSASTKPEGVQPANGNQPIARPLPTEPKVEKTAAGDQTVLPGAEKIGQGEQAQREADKPMQPKVAQKPADQGLFGDEKDQGALFSKRLDAMTNSPAFQRWFGKSKVVDAKGEPLVVYHGTTGDFSGFDAARLGSNTSHSTARAGFFFTADPSVASEFTQDNGSVVSTKDGPRFAQRAGANTMPVFLAVKNPLRITAGRFQRDFVAGGQDFAAFARDARAAGHDGLLIAKSRADLANEFKADTWVAFDPSQIKSATGNRGTFDQNSLDINESTRIEAEFNMRLEHSSPHGFDKFRWDDKVRGTGEGAQSFGDGVYLAENPKVAAQYREAFKDRSDRTNLAATPEDFARRVLQADGINGDRTKALAEAMSRYDSAKAHWEAQARRGEIMKTARFEDDPWAQKVLEAADLIQSGAHVGEVRTYTVDYKRDAHELLDWDNPVPADHPIRDLIAKHAMAAGRDAMVAARRATMTGEDAYRQMSNLLGSKKAATLALRDAGIPGIKYLDQLSRGNAQQRGHFKKIITEGQGYVSRRQAFLQEQIETGAPQSEQDLTRSYIAGREKEIAKAQAELAALPEPTHNIVAFHPEELEIQGYFNQKAPNPVRMNRVGRQVAQGQVAPFAIPSDPTGRTALQAGSRLFDAIKANPTHFLAHALAAGREIADAFRVFRSTYQDKMQALARVQDSIKRASGMLNAANDAYKLAGLFHGKKGALITDLQEDRIKPMAKILAKAGISMKEFSDFVYARHAPERNADLKAKDPKGHPALSGMTDQDANAITSAALNGPKAQGYLDAEKIFRQMIDETRARQLSKGLIEHNVANAWNAQYKYYVPLKGWEGEESEVGGGASQFNTKGPESKRATGRTTLADNPVANAIADAMRAIDRGEANTVGQAFLALVNSNPNPGLWAINRPQSVREIGPNGMIRTVTQSPNSNAAHVFTVKVGGKEVHIEIFHAGLASAMKNLDSENLGTMRQVIGRFTHLYSSLQTARNPEWFLRNIAGDLQEAMINAQGEGHKGMARSIMAGWTPAFKGALAAQSRDFTSPWAQTYREYVQAGGKVNFLDTLGADKAKAAFVKEIASHQQGVTKRLTIGAMRGLVHTLEHYNDAAENAVRLSTYKALRDRGMSRQDAAHIARNITIDFNRKGFKSARMNALYMFFNATMQGHATLFRNLKKPVVRKIAAGMVMIGMLEAIAGISGVGGSDGDDPDWYDKIPSWEREKNWIIPLPHSLRPGKLPYMKIKIPPGYSIFKNLGSEMVRLAMGKSSASEFAVNNTSAVANVMNPLGGNSLLSFILPTIFDPVGAIASNQGDFGQPLKPQIPFDKRPQSEQFNKNVNPVAKRVTDFLNTMTGGDKLEPGWLSISPGYVDYMMQFLGGGLGKVIVNAETTAESLVHGETPDPTRMPVVRGFYGEASGQAAQIHSFYDIKDRVEHADFVIKGRAKERDAEGMKASREEYQTELRFLPQMKAGRLGDDQVVEAGESSERQRRPE
jgi:hypothetical protein